jgi:hypothetical protein
LGQKQARPCLETPKYFDLGTAEESSTYIGSSRIHLEKEVLGGEEKEMAAKAEGVLIY